MPIQPTRPYHFKINSHIIWLLSELKDMKENWNFTDDGILLKVFNTKKYPPTAGRSYNANMLMNELKSINAIELFAIKPEDVQTIPSPALAAPEAEVIIQYRLKIVDIDRIWGFYNELVTKVTSMKRDHLTRYQARLLTSNDGFIFLKLGTGWTELRKLNPNLDTYTVVYRLCKYGSVKVDKEKAIIGSGVGGGRIIHTPLPDVLGGCGFDKAIKFYLLEKCSATEIKLKSPVYLHADDVQYIIHAFRRESRRIQARNSKQLDKKRKFPDFTDNRS